MPDGTAYTDWIAVDWGTSRLRAWAMSPAGEVIAEDASDRGMGGLRPDEFEPALLDLVEPWLGQGTTPVTACGMVGSRQGWSEAPYVDVPCKPLELQPVPVATRDRRLSVSLVPGIRQLRPPDVMRGEETQIAGYLSAFPGFDGVICLPGTHTKWAEVSAGEVVGFRSFMTGELFAVLSHYSVLRHSIGEGWDDAAFAESVADALSKPEMLAARLFTIRAEGLVSGLAPGAARARLSGLLTGAELAAARPFWLGRHVAVVGADIPARVYSSALALQGVRPAFAASDTMTRAGLAALRLHQKESAQ